MAWSDGYLRTILNGSKDAIQQTKHAMDSNGTTIQTGAPLDLTVDYAFCQLCPRQCGCDRTRQETGVCGESDGCRVASICPHFGEEPPISGTRGSGTVFLTGCACHCFFCQNHQISRGDVGEEIAPLELVKRLQSLASRGVHNLNFVTPNHFLPHLEWVCAELRRRGVTLPFVHNGSGYMTQTAAARSTRVFEIFLPDFKFGAPDLAAEIIGDPRYPRLAMAALKQMVRDRGFLRPWDPPGDQPATEGVLVRHLVLPGHVDNSLAVLDMLYREFGPALPLSLMSQYRPMPGCESRGNFARPLHFDEYEQVRMTVEALGFDHVFLQEMTDEQGYVPDFKNADNPFPGNSAPQTPKTPNHNP